jgi:multidrug transporter EmrE-like cation transporter
MNPIFIIIIAQLLFTVSDLIGRHFMSTSGFTLKSFLSLWFLGYFLIRNIAMFGQLYVFSRIELGHTMALFGAISIVLANVLGFLFLKEVLSPVVYIGVVLAIVAFLVLAVRV